MEVSGQGHFPAASPPHEEPPVLTEFEAGWSPELEWKVFRMNLAVTVRSVRTRISVSARVPIPTVMCKC